MISNKFYMRVLPIIFFAILENNITVSAQWNQDQFGFEWITYSKDYLRLQVTKKGIQRLPISNLPTKWLNTDPNKWQLWHRGKEIPIIRADNAAIFFYAETNDGASDSLVHRPSTSRLNQYSSLFSDQGIYFLTSADNPKRAITKAVDSSSDEVLHYHLQKDTVLFKNQFSFVSWGVTSHLNQSYYNESNSWTGPTIGGPDAWTATQLPRELILSYTLNNWYKEPSSPKPVVEMLFNALLEGQHDIRVDTPEGTTLAKSTFNGWGGEKVRFELSNEHISDEKNGQFKLHSISTSPRDWFSISYYTIEYPQRIDFSGIVQKLLTFNRIAESKNQSIIIENSSGPIDLYNISDIHNLSVLNGRLDGSRWVAGVERSPNLSLKLFAAKPGYYHDIPKERVGEVNFDPIFTYDSGTNPKKGPISPEDYDYIIITNDVLKEGAIEYARYRTSEEGGKHRTLVMHIRDVYDQFNYGEPSPVAIRTFMKHMLSKGTRDERHYLMLMGIAVSYPPFLVKELPDDVPTFGDPGSDNLLVAGLNGVNEDLQAIPVGRLRAYSNTEIRAYLKKVKEYEHEEDDISWRKNVLHLSGGSSISEINALQGILSNLEPIVTENDLGGRVSKVVKTITAVEKIDISNQVNDGMGLITFFGHGAQTITDLDFGFATDASRGYRNTKRYPLMYFNGCGVGNIYTSRRVHALSDDWLLAPEKGAIVVIANSYLSYVTPSARHINQLYRSLFESNEIKSIGYVLRDVNQQILNNNASDYDKANLHQAVLQGDPAIRVIRSSIPDYLIDVDEGIKLYAEKPSSTIGTSTKVRLALHIKNGGRVEDGNIVPVQLTLRYKNGSFLTTNHTIPGMAYSDTLWITVEKDEQIDKIEVKLDPKGLIEEFSKRNNNSELILNWEDILTQNIYPAHPVRDLIAPQTYVSIDRKPAKTESRIFPNTSLQIVLRDDRSLPADTSLLDVYIRSCWDNSCEYTQLSFGHALELQGSDDGRELQVDLLNIKELIPANYEILVQSRDRAGNSPPIPYTIRFTVEPEKTGTASALLVSPNPASEYVKFTLEKGYENENEILSVNYSIYTITGMLVHTESLQASELLKKEWYWNPSKQQNKPGIYFYHVLVTSKNNVQSSFKGKLIVVN